MPVPSPPQVWGPRDLTLIPGSSLNINRKTNKQTSKRKPPKKEKPTLPPHVKNRCCPFKGEYPPLITSTSPGTPRPHDIIQPPDWLPAPSGRRRQSRPAPSPRLGPVSFPRCSQLIGRRRWRSPAPLLFDWPSRRGREARGGRFRGCEAPGGGGEAGLPAWGKRLVGGRRLRQRRADSGRDGAVSG